MHLFPVYGKRGQTVARNLQGPLGFSLSVECRLILDFYVQALQLLEYIIKHGSERVVDDARSHLSTIKMLRNFHYIDDKGKDQGINGTFHPSTASRSFADRYCSAQPCN